MSKLCKVHYIPDLYNIKCVCVKGVRTLGGSGIFSSVTRPSGTLVCPAAWTQTRHSSFFNKRKLCVTFHFIM